MELVFSRQGKRTENAYIESFNDSFQDDCLISYWFWTLDKARSKITA